MNKLILLPLLIMMTCAALAQAMKVQTMVFNSTQPYYVKENIDNETGIAYDSNGNPVDVPLHPSTSTVDAISLIGVDGALTIMIAFIALGAVAGIHFLGSGLSDSSINVIYKSLYFYTLWGIFSFLGYGIESYGISSIPIFGVLFYVFITILYTIGVQTQINTHET